MFLKFYLLFFIGLSISLSAIAQGRPSSWEKIAQWTKHHHLQLLEINLTGEQYKENIHKINIVPLDRLDYYHLILLDEAGDYHIKKGNYQLNIWLDTIRPIAYTHCFSMDTLPLRLTFEVDTLLSNFDFSTSWLDFPMEKDTLQIWQHNDNSWFVIHDTLEVTTEAGAKKMTWRSHQKGGRKDTVYTQSVVMDQKLIEGFQRIETLLQYPKSIRGAKFESCDNCRGNQSMIFMRYRDYLLYFYEPKCRNGYWRKYRNLFFGWDS